MQGSRAGHQWPYSLGQTLRWWTWRQEAGQQRLHPPGHSQPYTDATVAHTPSQHHHPGSITIWWSIHTPRQHHHPGVPTLLGQFPLSLSTTLIPYQMTCEEMRVLCLSGRVPLRCRCKPVWRAYLREIPGQVRRASPCCSQKYLRLTSVTKTDLLAPFVTPLTVDSWKIHSGWSTPGARRPPWGSPLWVQQLGFSAVRYTKARLIC